MNIRLLHPSTFVHILARCFLAAALIVLGSEPGSHAAFAIGPLQALIDGAAAGSTVMVPAGTYNEFVTIDKNLTLAGSPGAVVIIQPPSGHSAITLLEGAAVITLRNLTIQNASFAGGPGGAVFANNSVLTVDHCTLSNNSANTGGAIFLSQGSLTVVDSSILDNHAVVDGGGIFSGGPLTLTNTLVKGNTADRHGGGAHGNLGLVTITGGRFENNVAGGNGGGLNMNDSLTINGATFQSNQSGADGGGVLQWNQGVQIQLTNVTFADNSAINTGGGMAAKGSMTVVGGSFLRNFVGDPAVDASPKGGGLYLEAGRLTLQGTTFENNESRSFGSFPSGGGMFLEGAASRQLTGAVFKGNKAWMGGGINSISGSLTLLNSRFIENDAGFGGAVEGSNITARDCLFEGNRAVNKGGAMNLGGNSVLERLRFLGNSTYSGFALGAALYIRGNFTLNNSAFVGNFNTHESAKGSALMLASSTENATLEHLTIANNTGGNGAGLQVEGGTQITMTNTIIANQVVAVCLVSGSLSINGILFSGNTSKYGTTACSGVPTVDHEIGNGTEPVGFGTDGYHITTASAAMNTAHNSTQTVDIDGEPRPNYGSSDMGADEYWFYHIMLPAVLR